MKFKTTGNAIKYLRKRKGLSQEELGTILGVKRVTVQKYEADSIVINADIIKKLCDCFCVPPWVLLFPEEFVPEIVLDAVEHYYARFIELNAAGRQKVNEYIFDLSRIEAYRRDGRIADGKCSCGE